MLRLNAASLNWALAHAEKLGDTDVFPIPFEFAAIRNSWSTIGPYLASQNVLEWHTRPHRALLSPKSRYGFRVITQLDPLDFLIFGALLFEIGNDIEKRRISIDEKIVFSYRFKPTRDGKMFDPEVGYRQYLDRCIEIVRSGTFSHVVIADIADFYPRIYTHRLENALASTTTKNNHVKSIIHLISGWNGTESYGIPVGNAPSRMLAEITISDIDEYLRGCGITFVRYNDDYRLFARSKTEAFRFLTILAETLYSNHCLTLQPQKTKILSLEEFSASYLHSPEEVEINNLSRKFHELIISLGLENHYQEIDYLSLSPEQQEEIDSLNLIEIFKEEIAKGMDADQGILKFILIRMGQIGDNSAVDIVFQNLEVLHPVISHVIEYFSHLRYLSPINRHSIGERVISLIQDSLISELSYHKMWILTLFVNSTEWDNEAKFQSLLNSIPDLFCRRKIILALGRAGHSHWFQSRWRYLFEESPWPRRALLAAASCMPLDARRHWYTSIEPRLDLLERAVVAWAKANPFR